MSSQNDSLTQQAAAGKELSDKLLASQRKVENLEHQLEQHSHWLATEKNEVKLLKSNLEYAKNNLSVEAESRKTAEAVALNLSPLAPVPRPQLAPIPPAHLFLNTLPRTAQVGMLDPSWSANSLRISNSRSSPPARPPKF